MPPDADRVEADAPPTTLETVLASLYEAMALAMLAR